MSSNMRKHLAAAGLVCALVLSACVGGGDDSASDQVGTEGPENDVTLTFWNGFTGPDRPALEELVERFNDSQDKVTIDMQIQPWDVMFQKLLPALASNEGPDIVAMDTVQLPQYASKGVFAELDAVYEQDVVDTDALVQSAVEATQIGDAYYGVPMNFTTLLLYWNKDMFKEAGLDPEQPPTNWDEWAEYAKELTIDENGDGKPEQYGYAIADHETIPMWPILLWGNGGDVVSDDASQAMFGDAASIEAVEYWSELVTEDNISPVGLTGADADKLFLSKKAAMEVVGPWMTAGFEDAGIDFGLGMVPAGPEEEVTLGTSVAMALNAKADEDTSAAAYEFFEYWNSEESQIYWAVNSGFPPTRTDIDEEQLSENPYVAEFGKYADNARFYLPGVQEYTKVNANVFEPTIQRILNDEGSPDELMPTASEEIQDLLEQAQT